MTRESCRSHGVNRTVICSCLAEKTIGPCFGILRRGKHTAISRLSRIGRSRRDGTRTTPTCSRQLPSTGSSQYRRYRTPILQVLLQTKLRLTGKISSRKHRRHHKLHPSRCPGLRNGSKDQSRFLSGLVAALSRSDLLSLESHEHQRFRSPSSR